MHQTEEYSTKSERMTGDVIWYFCLHNLISVFFFFLFTISFDIYMGQDLMLSDIFSKAFWKMVLFQVFPSAIISSIIGRITAYFIINGYIKVKYRKRRIKKKGKKWSELNRGINGLGLIFFFSAFITSIIYSLGLVSILQYAIFSQETLLTLIIIYIGLKLGTYLLVRWFVGAKL
ncbi:MAG: hypothetical protein ACFFDF_01045 [Candidatus Odinarchaeota archaeon]